jgi:hypothetical protein
MGMRPCAPSTKPPPTGQRRDVHALGAEQVQAEHRAGDVDDRVHRAHLVEVDLLEAGAVHLCLGLRQPREDPRGAGDHGGRQRAGVEDREDVAQLAMLVACALVQYDVGLRRAERAAPHLARLQPESRNRQLGELGAQRRERTPASRSAPRIMSPEAPLGQSK